MQDPSITNTTITSKEECPICMDPLKQTDVFTTRCGHMYHGTCMIRHIKNNDSCPMCRGLLFE